MAGIMIVTCRLMILKSISVHKSHLPNFVWISSAALLALSVLVWWSYSSYFGESHSSLLVFTGDDGWCDSATQGFGLHCWGDYAALRFEGLFAPPSGPEAPYPLGGRLIRLPFLITEMLFGSRAGVFVFLLACSASCLAPLILISKGWNLAERNLLVMLFGLFSVGFMASLDRGNTIALTVSPLFLLCRELLRESKRAGLLTLYGVILILLKPQMFVFCLVYLSFRNKRQFIFPVLAPPVVLITTQMLLGGGMGGVTSLITSAESWSQSLPSSAAYPTNLSVNKIAYVLGYDVWWIGYVVPVVPIIFIVIACWFGRQAPDSRDLITTTMCLTIFGQISYVYYSFLTIVAVSLLGSMRDDGRNNAAGYYSRHSSNLVLIGVVALNAPLAIGNSWVGLSSLPASNMWSLVALLLVFLGVVVHGVSRMLESGAIFFSDEIVESNC